MKSFAKSLFIVGCHVGVSLLAVFGLSTLVSFGTVFSGGLLTAVLLAAAFVPFSLFGLGLTASLVNALFGFEREGILVDYALGGLLGAAFIGICVALFPGVLAVAGILGALAGGFIGSSFVVVFGRLTGAMSTQWLPIRAKK